MDAIKQSAWRAKERAQRRAPAVSEYDVDIWSVLPIAAVLLQPLHVAFIGGIWGAMMALTLATEIGRASLPM